jgi:SAM-dependent MidA family methyltransferase
MSQASASPLQELIIERITREGALTFAEYMRMALYEPGYGYYVSGPARMGWTGDYFTSGDVSELFAHCLGRQLVRLWDKLRQPAPFVVLEQGAGRGNLVTDLRSWAEAEAPDLARALDYQTTDIRAGQDSLQSSEQASAHVLFSNELVDAFPVHLIEIHEGQVYEVYVEQREGRLCEVLAEPSTPEVADYLDHYRVPWQGFPDGWRAEVNLETGRWLEQAVRLLRRQGFILTIDYGEKARELYTRERRRGTLLCYSRHQTNERPLLFPGEQDITAHVNFSALIEQGRALGLRLHRYSTQRQWLEDCGLQDELEQRRVRDFALADTQRASDQGQIALMGWYNLRQRAALLSDPAGMGNFKVLILRADGRAKHA